MAVNLQAISDAPIIRLDDIDSTNNYAMRLIDADTAQEGMTIMAKSQKNGKGQRGNTWMDNPGESLLMSIIIRPVHLLSAQFGYNAAVTVAIAQVLQNLCENVDVRVKWPNDIILNDKKAGGVLIENVLRGSDWSYSVIGIGINVLQKQIPGELPHATSLYLESARAFSLEQLADMLRNSIIRSVYQTENIPDTMKEYNEHLFRRFEEQAFTDGKTDWKATILQARPNGQLEVQLEDGIIAGYTHGSVAWKW